MSQDRPAKKCQRCGILVSYESAMDRLRKHGVIFCTDCKSDKVYMAAVTTKG